MTTPLEQSGLDAERTRASDTSIEIYKAIRAHELMLNQATAAFEHAVVAPLIVLNGGAAVAFLTLLGAVADPEKSRYGVSPSWAVSAVILWALGLVFVELAVTWGFRSQREYSKRQRRKRQEVEWHLVDKSDPKLAEILAPPSGEAASPLDPRQAGKRFEFWRWASVGCFLLGLSCAAISLF